MNDNSVFLPLESASECVDLLDIALQLGIFAQEDWEACFLLVSLYGLPAPETYGPMHIIFESPAQEFDPVLELLSDLVVLKTFLGERISEDAFNALIYSDFGVGYAYYSAILGDDEDGEPTQNSSDLCLIEDDPNNPGILASVVCAGHA